MSGKILKEKGVLIAIAIIVLVGIVLLATGRSDTSEPDGPLATSPTTQKVTEADTADETDETSDNSQLASVLDALPDPLETSTPVPEVADSPDDTFAYTGTGGGVDLAIPPTATPAITDSADEVVTSVETMMNGVDKTMNGGTPLTDEILEMLKPFLVEIIKQLEQLVVDLTAYRDRIYKERGLTM